MSDAEYPFIYISSLMRTGSTLIAEALTRIPYSYIFLEPHIGKNSITFQQNQAETLAEYGIDVAQFALWRNRKAFFLRRLRWASYRQDYMMREFKNVLAPQLFPDRPAQIGVKEVRNKGWKNYLRHFPNMKVIITGRDPRDIFLSAYEWKQRGTFPRDTPMTPEAIAASLNEEFEIQLAIHETVDCMCILYEDFCTQPEIYIRLKEFVHSPIPEAGQIGELIAGDERRSGETAKHQQQITTLSVNRWRQISDPVLKDQADRMIDLMPAYCRFWNIRTDDTV